MLSSSDDCSESNSECSREDDECSNHQEQWDAFETLESNYQSSSESDDDDSCNDESIGEESEYNKGARAQECIELLNGDSESDDDSLCKKENELVDSEEEPATASPTVKKNKRRRIFKISDHFKPKTNNTRNEQYTTTQKISMSHQSPIG